MTVAVTTEGDKVPLEKWTDVTGPRRYRMVKLGPPHEVERVPDSSGTEAYPDHRVDCPDFNNGLLT